MRITMNKAGFMFLLISCVLMMATCGFNGCENKRTSEVQTSDTLFLSQWHKEKAEKQALVLHYETRIAKLQYNADSLQQEIVNKKKNISALRFKVKFFEDQLRDGFAKCDTATQTELGGTLDSLEFVQQRSDTACDETIHTFEQTLCNRDSTIALYQRIERNLKELQSQQMIESNYLTEQLNQAQKESRKYALQKKWLSAGLLLLSGISASLLATQHLK